MLMLAQTHCHSDLIFIHSGQLMSRMRGSLKIIDASLFLFFAIIALAVPLIDAQTVLPLDLFPKLLVDLKIWFFTEIEHYLVFEMPPFYVGIAWFELLFQWPVSLMCVYGAATSKPWFRTACLIYGSSFLTSVAPILGELVGSRRASKKLIGFYFPFVVFGVLSLVRGLIPDSGRNKATGFRARPALIEKIQ